MSDAFMRDLAEVTARNMADRLYGRLVEPSPLMKLLQRDVKPPTRRERLVYRLHDLRQRARDIWTILSGGDVHQNCGDW